MAKEIKKVIKEDVGGANIQDAVKPVAKPEEIEQEGGRFNFPKKDINQINETDEAYKDRITSIMPITETKKVPISSEKDTKNNIATKTE